jgi:hypothetical protein
VGQWRSYTTQRAVKLRGKNGSWGIWKRHADQIGDLEFKAEPLPHSDVIIRTPQACEVHETFDLEPAVTIPPPGRRYQEACGQDELMLFLLF